MPAAIDGLLQELWDRKGTDVHLTAGAPPLLRLDGLLVPLQGMRKLKPADIEKVVLPLLGEELTERPHSGRQEISV